MADQQRGDSIVVIGASAGGIDALSTLVGTLPADLPAPIVIAQHLDPRRESHLSDILNRRSTLPVRIVTDRETLLSGTIYVVPPNNHVEIIAGEVVVHPDHVRPPLPSVDLLFTTAAAAFGENTIAVILTGTGDDGSAGARDVKAAGGTVVIQNPATADFPGMPRALPATIVDIVANLETIGPLLGDLLSGTYPLRPPEQDSDLRGLLDQLRDRSGIDFSSYKVPTIMRRLQRRMVATGSATLPDYIRHLQRNQDEYSRLVNSFLIKVTEFFRDPEMFDYLRDKVIPAVVDEARRQGELRIWSAGCATGEEAYSLAILVAEALGDQMDGLVIRIFATDLDADAIGFARRGVYPASAVAAIPPEMVERYFTRVDSTYEVRKVIRSMVVLGQHDLAQRAPFPRIDVIFCRNVLIYFTTELQKRALQVFAFSLRDAGYLVLGKAETVSPLPEYFALEQARLKVYRRIGDRILMPTSRIRDTMAGMPSHVTPIRSLPADRSAARANREPQAVTAGERAESIVMRMPTGVIVVNQRYDIQTINAAARRLCGIHSEAVGQDLLHLVQYVPLLPLRNAIDAAFRGEATTLPIAVAADQTVTGESLDLEIRCYPDPAGTSGEPIESVTLMIHDTSAIMNGLRQTEGEAAQLRDALAKSTGQAQRLAEANRALVYANEELTTGNADLRSVNEELLVANEEVQSATEEVETLNEELQATNEELETLNEELQATVEELNTTNDDLQARSIELQDLAISLELQQRQSEAERDRVQIILDNLSDGVLVVNGRGEHVLSNDTFQSRFGVEGEAFKPEDATGRPLAEDLRLQDRVAAGEAFTTEFLLTDPDGTRHWYEATGQPVEDTSGERLGLIVVRDITDRSLRALQDEFLALASHELRTPLTSLSGSLQLLRRRLGDSVDERAIRQLEVAQLQTRHLTTLIRDLVDIVRLQTGRLVLNNQPVDLRTIVRDAADAAESITQGQAIALDLPDEPLVANADPNRLSQVLMNLLKNAIIYAPDTERIEVQLQPAEKAAEMRVRDYGPGVPPAERERIFARFTQLEPGSSQRNHSDGLGLGLYIAREIVVAHGGTITLDESVEPGATFVVRLPLNADQSS
jgi:two-component system, chemotaxis family, CheB/CheR fusion protein